MKESKYGRRGSAVPVHDLRIQQLEAEVDRLTLERDNLLAHNDKWVAEVELLKAEDYPLCRHCGKPMGG